MQGSAPARDITFPGRGGVLVRAVRHHDDHARLDAGALDDYLPFSQHEIEDADLVGRPWTADQLQFIRHEGPVRLVHGRPGSGKTTVLWKAVEARSGQRVLYPTWSRELTAAAEEHFRAFAPADVRVEARDFATFLGEVCGADVERRRLSESRALFAAATARLGRRQAGPWANRDAALHAEVRVMLLGLAVPGDTDSIPAGGLVRLSDATYRDRRAGDDGVGRPPASPAVEIVEEARRLGIDSTGAALTTTCFRVGVARDPRGHALGAGSLELGIGPCRTVSSPASGDWALERSDHPGVLGPLRLSPGTLHTSTSRSISFHLASGASPERAAGSDHLVGGPQRRA